MKPGEPSWVFVAHSQRDAEGQHFLYRVFNQSTSRFRPYFYSADNPTPPHAEKVRESIRKAKALIVLLSQPMLDRQHTRAWVGYEVGIASELQLPVIVVDPETAPVELPVPGATIYTQRPAGTTGTLDPIWKVLAETAGHLQPHADTEKVGEFWPDLLAALHDFGMAQRDSTELFHWVTCDFTSCQSRFFVPFALYEANRHPCPSCRTENKSWRVDMAEFIESYNKTRGNP